MREGDERRAIGKYFARTFPRQPQQYGARPRAGGFRRDYHLRRDADYYRRQMGRPQPRFGNEREYQRTPTQRARNVPWMNRAAFVQTYGPDADYDDWLDRRRYRQDDLDDPETFQQIAMDRGTRFAREAPWRDRDDERFFRDQGEDIEGIQYENEIAVEVYRKRERPQDELIEIDVEDLPVIGKKVKFEDE